MDIFRGMPEWRRRIIVNTILVVVCAAIYGVSAIPLALGVIAAVLLLEFVVTKIFNWYFGGADD